MITFRAICFIHALDKALAAARVRGRLEAALPALGMLGDGRMVSLAWSER
jgi:hypothetical protein